MAYMVCFLFFKQAGAFVERLCNIELYVPGRLLGSFFFEMK